MLKGARVWQCSPDAPWDFTWRFRRLGNVPRGKAWARLGNRPQQGFDRPREPSLRKPPVFTHSARERDAASSGAGSAGGCTVQGPQLVPRCASRVLRRRPREGSALATGQTGNSARRRGQRGASWRRPKLAREGEGSTAGFLAAATACACAACLAASTTSEKLALAASSSAAVRVFGRRRQQGGSELALATGL